MTSFHEMNQIIKKPVSYTGLVLPEGERQKVLSHFGEVVERLRQQGWEIVLHHMTINMGPAEKGPAKELLGQTVPLALTTLAVQEEIGVAAFGVETAVPSTNRHKHITLAVNRKIAKPVHSNNLTKWETIPKLELQGIVQEV